MNTYFSLAGRLLYPHRVSHELGTILLIWVGCCLWLASFALSCHTY